MLMYLTAQSSTAHDAPGETASIKVLLVSDWIENLARLKSRLRLTTYEVTYVQPVEALNQAGQNVYDFVVVDVGPEHLAYALREIRACTQLQNASLLVRAERLAEAFNLALVNSKCLGRLGSETECLGHDFPMASVLTKYRALPSLDVELAKLLSVRAQESSVSSVRNSNTHPEESVVW
ncbi:MAG TPA: hypothetical protein VFZ34_33270 [Blastocatellia bacterium]|nr:hypothetical protein [Blastocatellia bacterium]